MLFEKIVYATDLSAATDRMISCLGGLKPIGARKIVLVHALGLRHLHVMQYELARLIEPNLAAQKAAAEELGYEVSVKVAPGLPEFEVNRIAEESGASLVVVGSHGVTLAREVLIGGVALAILHRATVPVLVVRVQITEGEAGPRCETVCADFRRHILHPTDFSDTAERAFGYIEEMASSGIERVTLLHVQDRVRLGGHLEHRIEEFNRIDRERLERLRDSLLKRGAKSVEIELPFGSPLQEILRLARRGDISEIVMGSQGRGFISEVFLGSVSHQVARHAPVPVLFVPAVRK